MEDALAAFSDEPAPSSSKAAAAAAAVVAAPPPPSATQQQQEQQQERGPASKRADKLRGGDSTPQRARQAIDLGLEKFQAQEYRAAIDLFQLALEVGWWVGWLGLWGVCCMRIDGAPTPPRPAAPCRANPSRRAPSPPLSTPPLPTCTTRSCRARA